MGDTLGMGLDPYRPRRRTIADVLLVAVFLLLTAAAVAWGLLG